MLNKNRIISSGIPGLLLLGLSGCGIVKIGTGNCPNDSPPSGTIVYQGTFTGQNGATVTGAAEIYQDTSGNYIIRLDGVNITVPSGASTTSLEVIGKYGSSQVNSALNRLCGSQNYSTGLNANSGALTWSQVAIFTNAGPFNYGVAPLQTP